MSSSLAGTVVNESAPVAGAYVRIVGASGEFVGEKRTLEDGAFKFNLAPGMWTVRWFTPNGPTNEKTVELADGQSVGLELPV